MIHGYTESTEPPPRLLVSVRGADELEAAIRGGADIIDVKDTSRGSLGMASPDVIEDIAELLSLRAPNLGLSVALGELTEWADGRPPVRLPSQVRWAKVGLSGCVDDPEWYDRWVAFRRRFDEAAGRPLKWIAVSYGDHEAAAAPRPVDVLGGAIRSQCAGLLLDTFAKTSGSLPEQLSPYELTDICRRARELCLPVALAGKVGAEDVEWLCDLEPAIVAVRSAVCQLGDRTQPISEARVAALKQRLELAAGVLPAPTADVFELLPPAGSGRFAGV